MTICRPGRRASGWGLVVQRASATPAKEAAQHTKATVTAVEIRMLQPRRWGGIALEAAWRRVGRSSPADFTRAAVSCRSLRPSGQPRLPLLRHGDGVVAAAVADAFPLSARFFAPELLSMQGVPFFQVTKRPNAGWRPWQRETCVDADGKRFRCLQ
jgi:hypothetical protein